MLLGLENGQMQEEHARIRKSPSGRNCLRSESSTAPQIHAQKQREIKDGRMVST